MDAVDYSEILEGTASLCGMPDELAPEDFNLLRNFHDRRLQKAWDIEDWPDLCRTEQRWFAAFYDAATNYNAGVFVFYPGTATYYQCLVTGTISQAPTDGTGALNAAYWAIALPYYQGDDWIANSAYVIGNIVRNPSDGQFYQCISAHTSGTTFDATKFAVLNAFARKILKQQPGFTEIAELFSATDADPRVTTQLRTYQPDLYDTGWYFTKLPSGCTGTAYVWIHYRVKRPHLTGKVWDAEKTYATGRQVYFRQDEDSVGNFYTANEQTLQGESPATVPDKWDVVEIPAIFEGYLKEAGFTDWLAQEPDRSDEAPMHDAAAEGYLELEADKLRRQQGQVRRLKMS